MTHKGNHTWDLVLQYHKCPHCDFIIESRSDFTYENGRWTKNVQCDRCGQTMLFTKNTRPTFGPLIGDPQPAEIDWE